MKRLRFSGRLEKLEQSEVFASPQQLMRRLHVALNGAALRLTGKLYVAASADPATRKRIFEEVRVQFMGALSDAELDHLETGLRSWGASGRATTSGAAAGEPCDWATNPEPLAEW